MKLKIKNHICRLSENEVVVDRVRGLKDYVSISYHRECKKCGKKFGYGWRWE